MICSVCGVDGDHEASKFLNVSHHRADIFEGLEMLSCKACGSSWVSNPPSNAELALYYASTYKVARVTTPAAAREAIWDPRSASLVALARLFVAPAAGDLFVDIGPGGGGGLTAASCLLDRPRLSCIEHNSRAIAFLREAYPGILVATDIEDLTAKAGQPPKYVYSSHCFEHFAASELRAALAQLYGVMKPGGALVCEVPNVPVSRLPKARNHAPHLIFFSQDGLSGLLESVGFDVKLCVGTLGKSPHGAKYVERVFADADAPADVLAKMSAFNSSGDWIAAREALVIKCVAVKTRR